MNPMTNVKNIKKLSEQELTMGMKTSWHDQYKDSAWIFIGGLPYDLTEGDVLCIFSQYGEIVNINLVRDKATGKQKGFCFICYEDQRSTVLAVDNLNGIKILGRTIRVDHVTDYKAPKEIKIEDPEMERLRKEGCAPSTQKHTVVDLTKVKKEPLIPEKNIKKEKKKKVKKEKIKKRKQPSGDESGSDSEAEVVRNKKSKKKKKACTSSSSSSSLSSSSSSSSSSSDDDSDSEGTSKKIIKKKKKYPSGRDSDENYKKSNKSEYASGDKRRESKNLKKKQKYSSSEESEDSSRKAKGFRHKKSRSDHRSRN